VANVGQLQVDVEADVGTNRRRGVDEELACTTEVLVPARLGDECVCLRADCADPGVAVEAGSGERLDDEDDGTQGDDRRNRKRSQSKTVCLGAGVDAADRSPPSATRTAKGSETLTSAGRGLYFFELAFPPLRPAAFFCAVVPPCFELDRLLELDPDFFPPRLDAPGEFAIFAARSFDMPFFFSPSYCFSFLTFARLFGIGPPFAQRTSHLVRRKN